MEKAKKTTTKKAAAKKTAALKKAATKKTVAKKTAAKSAEKKTTAKKTATKKTATKKVPAKKTATKKTVAKKTTAKKVAKKKLDPTLEVVEKCRTALDDKKADDIKVLDVRGKSPITNYFVIATANSEPHLRALAGELERTLKGLGVKSVGRDYNTSSGWVVVDAFDFMAHIFLPEQRGLYGMESLWKDAEEVRF